MIAQTVDIHDPEWLKTRDEQWVSVEKWLVDYDYALDVRLVLREIFYGRIDYHTDSSLDIIDPEKRARVLFNLNPYQCEKNWEWIIKTGWNAVNPKTLHKTELEIYSDYVTLFRHEPFLDDLPWTLNEKLACFKFLFGEIYQAKDFSFMGHKLEHPLNPYWVLNKLAYSISASILGSNSGSLLWPHLYKYGIAAFDYIDTQLFLPQSKATGVDNNIQAEVKGMWCRLFYELKNHKQEYDEYKKTGYHSPQLHSVSFEKFIQIHEISELLGNLHADIQSGVIPKEMHLLKDFAESAFHRSPDQHLRRFTLSPKRTFDGLKEGLVELQGREEQAEKEKKNKRNKKRATPPLDPATEKTLCAGLESFRRYALQESLLISDQPFDSVKKYVSWTKQHGIKLSKDEALDEVKRINGLKDKPDNKRKKAYAEILQCTNTGYIHLDVFGECSPGTINHEYRAAWKELFRLVGSAVIVKSLKVNKKGNVEDGYDIKVTIVTDKQTHVFNYVMDSDWLDESLLSDANVFAENEGLRWRYQFDDGDAGKSVTYLSPAIVELLK